MTGLPAERDIYAGELARLRLRLGPRERVTFTLHGGGWESRSFDPDDPNPGSCSVVGRGESLAGALRDLLGRL